ADSKAMDSVTEAPGQPGEQQHPPPQPQQQQQPLYPYGEWSRLYHPTNVLCAPGTGSRKNNNDNGNNNGNNSDGKIQAGGRQGLSTGACGDVVGSNSAPASITSTADSTFSMTGFAAPASSGAASASASASAAAAAAAGHTAGQQSSEVDLTRCLSITPTITPVCTPPAPEAAASVQRPVVATAQLHPPSANPTMTLSGIKASGQRALAATALADPSPRVGNYPLWQLAQEVNILGRCRHPCIIRLLAACLKPPRVCLVLELMDTSLDRLLFGRRRRCVAGGGAGGVGNGGDGNVGGGTAGDDISAILPLDKVLHIALRVAQGLEYLHPSIIHRDLKPANVLLRDPDSSRPIVRIADFGLARLRAMTLPTMHPCVGTVPYMAPECFDVGLTALTHRVDIYSFGVLLWTMLTGQQPWQDYPAIAIAYGVGVLNRRPPLDYLDDERCPLRLKHLMCRCWDFDPLRRPAAADVVKELLMIRMRRPDV
ncbi:hypothetical protein Vretifemale_2221, partial [Volvox reticuliferus]